MVRGRENGRRFLAVALATDRKRMIDTVTYGVNVLGDGDQPAFSWAHDDALKPIPYDPAQARAVLDAAGWRPGPDGIRVKNGRRLHITVTTTTGGNAVGVRTSCCCSRRGRTWASSWVQQT